MTSINLERVPYGLRSYAGRVYHQTDTKAYRPDGTMGVLLLSDDGASMVLYADGFRWYPESEWVAMLPTFEEEA